MEYGVQKKQYHRFYRRITTGGMEEESKEKGAVDHVNADAIGGADEHADADARWGYANAHGGGEQRKGSWNVAPGWEATFRLHFSNGHFNDVAAYGKKWIQIFPVIFIAFSVQLKQQLTTTMMMSAMLPRNAGLGLGQAPRCQGRAGRADAEGLARTPDRHDPGFEMFLLRLIALCVLSTN